MIILLSYQSYFQLIILIVMVSCITSASDYYRGGGGGGVQAKFEISLFHGTFYFHKL